MRRICFCLIFFSLFMLVNSKQLDEGFSILNNQAYAHPEFNHLSNVLYGLKPGDISLCIAFVKNSEMAPKEIADFVFEWNPTEHKRSIASVFRSKITRLAERLKRIDYEQLIIEIDLIKNSHLTTGQIIKILKGLNRQQG